MNKVIRAMALGLAFTTTSGLWAQNFNWQTIGPDNLGGRVRALHVTPDGQVFAGGAGSGLWKCGVTQLGWSPVESFNNARGVRSLCISSIAQDGATMYVATGELAFKFDFNYIQTQTPKNFYEFNSVTNGYPGGLGQLGAGVFVSENGGTFSNVNATCRACVGDGFDVADPWISVQKLAAHNGRVFAATFRGLYYTDDKFQSVTASTTDLVDLPAEARFEFDKHALENSIVYDVEIGSDGRVYAATRSHLFISTDNGATFSAVRGYGSFYREQPNFSLDRNRIEISVAPGRGEGGADLVYLVEIIGPADGYHAGIWMSTDGGLTFDRPANRIGPESTLRGGSGNPIFAPLETTGFNLDPRGLFSCVLEYDRARPERVLFGGQQLWEYTPEGSWQQLSQPQFPRTSPAFVPPLICALAFDPSNPRRFFMGTSQEVVRTDNGGQTFEKLRHSFEGALAFSAVETANGKIFAAFDGASVALKPTGSEKGFQFLSTTRKFGKVAASIYNPKHLLAGGQYGGVRRSLSEGEVFELFTGASIPASYDDEFQVVSSTLLNETFLSEAVFGTPNQSREKWVVVNGDEANRWVMGRGAGNPFERDQELAPFALYITSNPSGANSPYQYNTQERAVCHVYRDFIVPFTTKLDGAKLDFWYKANGEQNADELRIFSAPLNFVPQANEVPSGTGLNLLGRFHQSLNNDWKNETINLPNTLIGQKFRLIFTWVNDNSGGGGQPVAIDHITLTADNEIIGEDQFTQGKTPLPWSAFVLDEVASFGDTALNTEQKVVNEQYVFVGVNDQVWCVRAPFGASTGDVDDVLPTWTRITPHNNNASTTAITAMAISGDSTRTLFYGNNLGEIYRIRNAHRLDGALERAVRISPASGLPRRWIRSLTVHPTNPNILVVTYAYYGQRLAGTVNGSQIFITHNALSPNPTFKSLHGTESLPFVPIHCAMFNPDVPDLWLLIGTDRGLYVLSNPTSEDFWPNDPLLFEPPTPEQDWREANDGQMLPIPVYDITHKKWALEQRFKPDTVVVGTDTTVRMLPFSLVRYNYDDYLYISTMGRGVLRSDVTVGREERRLPENKPAVFTAVLYPNPTRADATIELKNMPATTVRFSLLDVNGKELWSATQPMAGNARLDLPMHGRPAGVYFVRVAAPGFAAQALKLVVER